MYFFTFLHILFHALPKKNGAIGSVFHFHCQLFHVKQCIQM